MTTSKDGEPKKYWLKINDQALIRFEEPLNPGFVFWLKRRFRARVHSVGGERVTVRRKEPFTPQELEELYWETEYRQQRVSSSYLSIGYDFLAAAAATTSLISGGATTARKWVRKRYCP